MEEDRAVAFHMESSHCCLGVLQPLPPANCPQPEQNQGTKTEAAAAAHSQPHRHGAGGDGSPTCGSGVSLAWVPGWPINAHPLWPRASLNCKPTPHSEYSPPHWPPTSPRPSQVDTAHCAHLSLAKAMFGSSHPGKDRLTPALAG